MDGSTPIKYGLRLPMDATFNTLKERLFPLCHVPANHLLIAEVSGAMIKVMLYNSTFPSFFDSEQHASSLVF